jgi:hypothetical protein
MVEIGTITPLLGLNASVVRSMKPDVPMEICLGYVAFVIMELIIVGNLIALM